VTLPVAEGKLPALDAEAVPTVDTPEWLYVHDLAVLAEARSLGLGKRFMAEAERVAREKGLRGLALVAVQGAEGYWAKAGFVMKTGTSPELAFKLASFGGGAVYMEKALGVAR
jgi:GNAT superfamily N-acetyltransferase